MSNETQFAAPRDPRTALAQDKYFTLRPKPLEHWLWRQSLPQAAERVFWVHWEEGMRAGDWCSQLSLRRVAQLCCIDPSTVTRAYQQLKALGLIRREDPGRDAANPFQQATALTEVRLPREVLTQLHQAPNRTSRTTRSTATATLSAAHGAAAALEPRHGIPEIERASVPSRPKASLKQILQIRAKLSSAEKVAYQLAWEASREGMPFDAQSTLSAGEKQLLLEQLQARARPTQAATVSYSARSPAASGSPPAAGPRRLTPLDAARLRKRIAEAVSGTEVPETFRQILWAVEEGALRRFETAKAINIALKKLREGLWTRPNRMPPQWHAQVPTAISSCRAGGAASLETCGAA